jgi:hypothetical protein
MLVEAHAWSWVRAIEVGGLGGRGAASSLLALPEPAASCFWKNALIVSCGATWALAARADVRVATGFFAFNCVLEVLCAARRSSVVGYRPIIVRLAARGTVWTVGVGVGTVGGQYQRRLGSGFVVGAASESDVFLLCPAAGSVGSPPRSWRLCKV